MNKIQLFNLMNYKTFYYIW